MLSNLIIIIIAIVLFIIGYTNNNLPIQGISFGIFGLGVFWSLIENLFSILIKWLKSLL